MKRIAFTLLVVLLAFSYVGPALAQSDHACSHGDATIEDLRACFEHAVKMGHVDNRGVANSLFDKLDDAQAALDLGQPDTAAEILSALINQIEAQAGKHIDETHADHMIAHTQQVIGALG